MNKGEKWRIYFSTNVSHQYFSIERNGVGREKKKKRKEKKRKEKKRGRRKVQADRVGRQGRPASSRQAGRQASKQANTSKQASKEGR
ncbi:hypothetical protein HZH66_014800 [Vespula vulgaris]|uniref:Uncharacterized protein n=1 Tax=Vespula vulgaris TaxID=7454 RepID=A0A834MPZ1_VESVU|nr:hypothetical protein HZH66_014800 [Vespula vulgaris]